MPPPPSKLRIDNDRLSSSSRKRRSNHSIVSPRTFLTGIVFAASGLLSLSIYLTTRLDGQSLPTSQTASSSSYVKGDATAAISDGENDDVRPVICYELLKDTTIWDPSKLHIVIIPAHFYLNLSSVHLSDNNFCRSILSI